MKELYDVFKAGQEAYRSEFESYLQQVKDGIESWLRDKMAQEGISIVDSDGKKVVSLLLPLMTASNLFPFIIVKHVQFNPEQLVSNDRQPGGRRLDVSEIFITLQRVGQNVALAVIGALPCELSAIERLEKTFKENDRTGFEKALREEVGVYWPLQRICKAFMMLPTDYTPEQYLELYSDCETFNDYLLMTLKIHMDAKTKTFLDKVKVYTEKGDISDFSVFADSYDIIMEQLEKVDETVGLFGFEKKAFDELLSDPFFKQKKQQDKGKFQLPEDYFDLEEETNPDKRIGNLKKVVINAGPEVFADVVVALTCPYKKANRTTISFLEPGNDNLRLVANILAGKKRNNNDSVKWVQPVNLETEKAILYLVSQLYKKETGKYEQAYRLLLPEINPSIVNNHSAYGKSANANFRATIDTILKRKPHKK